MASRMQTLIQEYMSLGGNLEEARTYAREIVDMERNERAMEREIEKAKWQHEKELEQLRYENQRMLAETESRTRIEVEASRSQSRENQGNAEESISNFRKYDLGLGKFSNEANDLDAFISRFELVAKAYRLPDELKAIEFSKCLTGPALLAYEVLSNESKLDYDEVVKAMRRRFGVTVQSLRKRFLNAKCLENEGQMDYAIRLKKYYLEWLDKAGYQQTYDDILEHIVLDRYYQSQPNDLRVFLKERGKLSLHDMTDHAENYIEAHACFSNDRQSKMSKDKKFENRKFKSGNDVRPYNANGKALPAEGKSKSDDIRHGEKRRVTCFICGKEGHKSFDCRLKKSQYNGDRSGNKAAACQVINDKENNTDCREGPREIWPIVAVADVCDTVYLKDLKYPLKGKAKIGNMDARFLRDTGSSVSIVKETFVSPEQYTGSQTTILLADRCVRKLPNAVVNVRIPYFEGPLKVCVMTNPVSDLIIGNDLYADDKNDDSDDDSVNIGDECLNLTRSTLIFDNSKYQKPLVSVNISPVNISSQVSVCNSEPRQIAQVYEQSDINYEMGADECITLSKEVINDVVKSDEFNNCESDDYTGNIAAVQTRGQHRDDARSKRPLKVTVVDALNITPDEFRLLQESDDKLHKLWQLALNPPVDCDLMRHKFVIKNGLLYRNYKPGPHDEGIVQLVVPNSLEQKVISFAHDTALSGHGSIAATYKKLSSVFHVLGASSKCRDYVKSCLICQKGGNKNTGFKAPMLSMPVVREPFETVYVDLVGEIHPASAENHKWILCATDACTHFPIAIPLKKIDSVTIAEAMLSQFSIFGHPRQIICDNAANLTSDILKEIYHVYGIEVKQIPVYRPQANSVQERSHAHIKSILRKLCTEQPRQWHRYIDPLMFAIRTTENANKFTPFELLYGRLPRTHMDVLRDLWTGQNENSETKTTYQYVLDLRNRIEETCKLAQDEIAKTHFKNKRYFDKHAKLRELKPGGKVLVLSPKPSNKLEFIWKGPATVIERRGVVNYRIRFDSGKERLYHVNMLKPFIDRTSSDEISTIVNEDNVRNDSECNTHNVDSDSETVDCDTIATVKGLIEDSEEETDEEITCKNDKSDMLLYNSDQTETWKDVKINPDLNDDDKRKVVKLLKEFQDIFSDVPTTTHLIKHKIKLKTDEPICCKPYKVPIHMVERVNKEIDQMMRNAIIEKSSSNFASPMVVVKKKNTDELRICVDFSRLNAQTINDPMPQPEPEDILAKLGNAQLFSVFDASKGYWAIPVDEDSKDYLSFVTERDCYRFNCMPFGCCGAGASYNRMVRMMLEGAKNLDHFVDDLVAFTSNDFDVHLLILRDLFERVRNANIKLRPSKARICFRRIEFLGFDVSEGQIRPTEESIVKVLNAPIPRTKKGVKSLCGCINWLRRYIPKAAKLLKPLTDLTAKNASEVIKWNQAQDEAFQEVKRILTSKPVLCLYDSKKEHVLQTDASNEYIAGVLLQRQDDDQLHPVMYISRKCNEHEMRYDIQNKEMLAIIWSCRRLYKYLFGSHFVIQTDCQALTMLNGRLSNNARVARWQLEMQSYDFRVEIIKGSDNGCADFLSRMGT